MEKRDIKEFFLNWIKEPYSDEKRLEMMRFDYFVTIWAIIGIILFVLLILLLIYTELSGTPIGIFLICLYLVFYVSFPVWWKLLRKKKKV